MMNNKKMIAGIITACLVIVIGSVFVYSNDFYNSAEHILVSDVNMDENAIYYIYKEDCSHCTAIKSDVADYYNTSEDTIYLIDGAAADNASFWSDEGLADDLGITGTPSILEVKDGSVVDVSEGEVKVLDFISQHS